MTRHVSSFELFHSETESVNGIWDSFDKISSFERWWITSCNDAKSLKTFYILFIDSHGAYAVQFPPWSSASMHVIQRCFPKIIKDVQCITCFLHLHLIPNRLTFLPKFGRNGWVKLETNWQMWTLHEKASFTRRKTHPAQDEKVSKIRKRMFSYLSDHRNGQMRMANYEENVQGRRYSELGGKCGEQGE